MHNMEPFSCPDVGKLCESQSDGSEYADRPGGAEEEYCLQEFRLGVKGEVDLLCFGRNVALPAEKVTTFSDSGDG